MARRKENLQRKPLGLAFKGPLVLVAVVTIFLVLVLAYAGNGYVVNNTTASNVTIVTPKTH